MSQSTDSGLHKTLGTNSRLARGLIPPLLLASPGAMSLEDAGAAMRRFVPEVFVSSNLYRTSSVPETYSGGRSWRQAQFPSEDDFASLAVSILDRQTSLGKEIERILSEHLHELYE